MATLEKELQQLLRGEIAAAETYNQVLNGQAHPHAEALRRMQGDHGRAIAYLRTQLDSRGLEAPNDSGVWGHFARLVEGSAKLLGDRTALMALREGEERGLQDYLHAVRDASLPVDCRVHIEKDFVPAQRNHVDELDRILRSM
jgi:hypothetical protein